MAPRGPFGRDTRRAGVGPCDALRSRPRPRCLRDRARKLVHGALGRRRRSREAQAYLVGGSSRPGCQRRMQGEAVLSNAYLSRFGVSLGRRARSSFSRDVCGLVETSRIARCSPTEVQARSDPLSHGFSRDRRESRPAARSAGMRRMTTCCGAASRRWRTAGPAVIPTGQSRSSGASLRVFADELERHLNGDRCNGHGLIHWCEAFRRPGPARTNPILCDAHGLSRRGSPSGSSPMSGAIRSSTARRCRDHSKPHARRAVAACPGSRASARSSRTYRHIRMRSAHAGWWALAAAALYASGASVSAPAARASSGAVVIRARVFRFVDRTRTIPLPDGGASRGRSRPSSGTRRPGALIR